MLHSEGQDDVQVIRLGGKNRTVHIATHQDPSSGKTIVLWSDVLRVFRDALYLQHGQKVLPFLKGADFEDLKPFRIAAVPGVTLEVAVQDELIPNVQSPQQQQQPKPIVTIGAATSTVRRNPAYGDELAALENYNHIDPPSDFAVGKTAVYGGAGTAIGNSSSSGCTPIDRPRAAAVGRNPSYGDELAALENYNHIDLPNTSARGPQLIPDNPAGSSKVSLNNPQEPPNSTKSGPRAPQFHPEEALRTCTDESPQQETPKTETTQQGWISDKNDDGDTEPTLSKQVTAVHKQQGNAEFQRGLQHEEGLGGVWKDYSLAMEFYLKAAAQGHAEAQHSIGLLYENGRGVLQDSSKALEWYLKAAKQGHPQAQKDSGRLYRNGQGVRQNFAKAMAWYLKAAEQGHAGAQAEIGSMYEYGFGVPNNHTKAAEWYLKAAEQGVAKAQFNMGWLYYGGLGVPRDTKKAVEWHLKAAEQGYKAAQRELGEMYRLGLGVPKDESKSVEWYIRSRK